VPKDIGFEVGRVMDVAGGGKTAASEVVARLEVPVDMLDTDVPVSVAEAEEALASAAVLWAHAERIEIAVDAVTYAITVAALDRPDETDIGNCGMRTCIFSFSTEVNYGA
jgi:Na+-translocating ferredoxin:NAD+ oxidoreductase RnfD subunit